MPHTPAAWLVGFLRLIPRYYTMWSCAAFVALNLGWLHPAATTTVHMMLTTSAVGGFFVTHVHPRRLLLMDVLPLNILIQGRWLYLGDVFSHHVPLIISVTRNAKQGPMLPYLITILAYFLLNDPRARYGLRTGDVLVIAVVVIIMLCWV